MPATFFHAYHGENVYNLLSDEVKDKLQNVTIDEDEENVNFG